MGKPPGHDDDTRDPAEPAAAHGDDPDRAAILARRQRFIAIALSGLATATACDKPKADPSTPKDAKADESKQDDKGAPPQACLKVAPPEPVPADGSSTGMPMPCLDVAPPEPEPIDDGSPQACLKIVRPPPEEPKPKPQPCLKVRPPEPDPKPQPCLKVRQPEPEPEPKPQPCLRVAKPT
jgi:hypothetical protein